jgi:SNF2 family DNA or RNA helicase
MKTANFGGRSVQIVTGYQHLGELSEKLKAFSYRVLKDDCLDLPAKTFIKRMVQLTPDQTKLYKQMKVLALAQMDGKIMTTATVLTQLMRLQQITCGHFTADDGTIKEVDSNRLPELMNVLEEIEGKVVIWAHWQRDVNRIIREISKKFGENSFVDYYGLTPMSERQKNIEKFQDPNSSVKYFIGTTQTGGYGITLTAASNMIYYSNGYDLEKRQQSEARIDRIGQHYPMTYIDIMCEHTVDERIVKALKKKVDIASQIMGEELKDWI